MGRLTTTGLAAARQGGVREGVARSGSLLRCSSSTCLLHSSAMLPCSPTHPADPYHRAAHNRQADGAALLAGRTLADRHKCGGGHQAHAGAALQLHALEVGGGEDECGVLAQHGQQGLQRLGGGVGHSGVPHSLGAGGSGGLGAAREEAAAAAAQVVRHGGCGSERVGKPGWWAGAGTHGGKGQGSGKEVVYKSQRGSKVVDSGWVAVQTCMQDAAGAHVRQPQPRSASSWRSCRC